jgi:hypothetical protein
VWLAGLELKPELWGLPQPELARVLRRRGLAAAAAMKPRAMALVVFMAVSMEIVWKRDPPEFGERMYSCSYC